MKHLTILAALAIAFAMPCTALANTYESDSQAAWDAECSGNLSVLISGQYKPESSVSASDFKYQGVVEYNGHEETWYSSNALYHYRTGEWTADEDGFYKTDEGYFVVASDAYEEGTVIETSRGLAQVLDSGCGENIDFYVNF